MNMKQNLFINADGAADCPCHSTFGGPAWQRHELQHPSNVSCMDPKQCYCFSQEAPSGHSSEHMELGTAWTPSG